jgi:hypothetical protein
MLLPETIVDRIILISFDRREGMSVSAAANLAGKSVSTIRGWCCHYGLGRRIGDGTLIVSRVPWRCFSMATGKLLRRITLVIGQAYWCRGISSASCGCPLIIQLGNSYCRRVGDEYDAEHKQGEIATGSEGDHRRSGVERQPTAADIGRRKRALNRLEVLAQFAPKPSLWSSSTP